MIHWRQSVLILILLMIALLAIAGWNWLRSGLPQIDGQIYLPNLKQPVQIQRDHYGIIFIKSKTQRDAYTALGYAHAQDRLWQMELMRRAGAGRLSEIFGTRTSQTDRFLRTLGLRKAAEKSILQLSIEVLDALSAYSDGVNAYIKAHKNDLPPEFTLFKIIPEPWKPLDSMIWQKLMAMSLSQNWRTEALRAQLATQLSSSDIQLFLPVKNQGAPLKSSITTIKARDWASLREIYPPSLMSYGASNAWVIAGNRSASGKPLLANDPHLSLELPILWYLARIDAPDYHIAGATVPGVPFHILGHNTNIAWGFTSSGTDVEDLIIEQTDPENPNNYLTENGSTPYLLHTEDLRIHNAPTEHLIIRETRHGPIISDVLPSLNFLDSSKTIALRSTTLSEKDLTAESLYRVNTARNVTDLKDALDLFMAPVQNVVFADTLGNIGIRLAGLVPIRSTSEQGPIPTDGSTADRRWKGFVPPKDLPQINNPSQGFLSNANESLSSELISEFEPPYRSQQLVERLSAQSEPFQLRDMAQIQMDTISKDASILLPLMLEIKAKTSEAQKALTLLQRWDFRMTREKPEPLIYVTWLTFVQTLLIKDDLGSMHPYYAGLHPEVIHHILSIDPQRCDDTTTSQNETCSEQLVRALELAITELDAQYGTDIASWRWGAAHRLRLIHPFLKTIPFLEYFTGRDIATDGGDFTLNRGQTNPYPCCDLSKTITSWPHVHGAGYRAVYDLSDLNRSGFVITTGQSGHVLSSHYLDMVDPWRSGAMITLPETLDGPRGQTLSILTLAPEVRP